MSQTNVLITGGSRGIGRAIALRFAREGCKVAIASRSSNELDAVVAEIDAAGGDGLAAQLDLKDIGSVEAAVWRAVDHFEGRMDVLVNNAGLFDVKPIEETSNDMFKTILEVNLTGAFLVTKEAMESLAESERGHIFNIASIAAKQGFAGSTAYCASKYGLRGFGDALREEVRDKKIRVSTVYPQATDTTIFDNVAGDWDRSKMNKPEDIANAIYDAYAADQDADDIDIALP
ncbi:MAG: NAD(P)-dependent dehydrogenase (short-subunit alcohol dehydrogenase family) [Planctomycetota bacterium]|jgi:NAD(P)-dependent dehydrogenase (short-subunit alcohol dehydrogenase family)